jgi:hypothetical protein
MTMSLPVRPSQPKGPGWKGVLVKEKAKATACNNVESEEEEEGPSNAVKGALQCAFNSVAEPVRYSTPSPAPLPAPANHLEACNMEATALIREGHTIASGLTSEEGSRLLRAFRTLLT